MNPSVVTAGSSWLSPSRRVIRLSAVLQHQFPTHIKHCRSYKPKPQIFLPLKPSYCCQRWRTGVMRSCHLLQVICCTGAHKALRCTLQQPHWFFFSQTSRPPSLPGRIWWLCLQATFPEIIFLWGRLWIYLSMPSHFLQCFVYWLLN